MYNLNDKTIKINYFDEDDDSSSLSSHEDIIERDILEDNLEDIDLEIDGLKQYNCFYDEIKEPLKNYSKESIFNYICCLCGCNLKEHNKKTHHFIKLEEKYKCIKCNKYFFEHEHNNNDCYFKPHEYIV